MVLTFSFSFSFLFVHILLLLLLLFLATKREGGFFSFHKFYRRNSKERICSDGVCGYGIWMNNCIGEMYIYIYIKKVGEGTRKE